MKRFSDLIYKLQPKLNFIKIINCYYKIQQQQIMEITNIHTYKFSLIARTLIS
jgi:hypothetical protein